MKLISYIAIICVILGITTLSLTCYFVRPMEGPISCKALSEANQPKSAVPFFSQGIVFAAGIVFFIVVTAIGEWTQNQSEDDIVPDEKMNKWEDLLLFYSAALIGMCIVVSILLPFLGTLDGLSLSSGHKIRVSPSFVDACKPNPNVSSLCGQNFSSETFVNVTCTGHRSEWIPALSPHYSPMIYILSFLMITLLPWAILRIDSGPLSLFIGATSMILMFGIGIAAGVNKESTSEAIFKAHLFGALFTTLYWILFLVIFMEKYFIKQLFTKRKTTSSVLTSYTPRQQLPI